MAGQLWSDILQVGKWDGVAFDFVSVRDEGGNELDKQELPGRNGTFVQGRARNGRRFSVLAIIIEDDYPDVMNQLVAKLENGGEPKDFVHPVRGTFKAACEHFSLIHDAEDSIDSATIQIDFVEHTEDSTGPTAVKNTTPARANAVRSKTTDVLTALSAFQAATEIQSNAYVVEVQAAVNAASDIADSLEATGDELSSPEIQKQTNAVLSTIDQAVAAGADYDSTEAYELGAAVLAMSAAVSDLANDLLAAKPPLQLYTVSADTNLLALAHDLYGDSSRADELLSLNSIPDPSLIPAGAKVAAYGV